MLFRKYSCVSILVIFAIFAAGSLFDDIYADNGFLGGTLDDFGYDQVQDSEGNMYFVMYSSSVDVHGITKTVLPYTANSGFNDFVLIKMNPELTRIIEGTYIGGSLNEFFPSIAIDSNDNIFVTGRTDSPDLPNVSGASQETIGGGKDSFVTKLDSLLNVTQTTYLGGSLDEEPVGIDIDSRGYVYVFGTTSSTDFPFATGKYTSSAGAGDVFITKLYNTLRGTPVSTYYGSTTTDHAGSMIIDSADNIIISGSTDEVLPEMGGLTPLLGSVDAFVVKFNNNLRNIISATYVGGNVDDYARGLGIDSNGNVFVTGITESNIFTRPTTSGGAFSQVFGNYDLFLTKLDSDLNGIQSTYFGGNGTDYAVPGSEIVFDSLDNVYLAGGTNSLDLPNTEGGVQENLAGPADVFMTKFNNDLTTNIQSTYLGATNIENVPINLLVSGDTLYVSLNSRSLIDADCSDTERTSVYVGIIPMDLLYDDNWDFGGKNFFQYSVCSYPIVPDVIVELPIAFGGSGSGCYDCIDPTFYYSRHKIIVEDGFRYNDYSIDVTDKHTATELIITPTNYTNYVILKVYDNGGIDNIKWIDVGFGSPGVDDSFDLSEVIIETRFLDNLIKSSIIKDKLNLIDFGNVTSQIVDCGYIDDEECIEITIPHTFRDVLSNNGIMISATDYYGNEKYHFINEGVKVIGNSLNELPTDRIFAKKYLASHAEWIDLVRIDRVNDVWISEEGLEFKRTEGNGFQRMIPLGFAD